MKEGNEFIKGFKKGQKKILEDWLFFLGLCVEFPNSNIESIKKKRKKIIKILEDLE